MIKLKDILLEKISGKKFKAKNKWYGMQDNAYEEDFFDEVEWQLWKMFGERKTLGIQKIKLNNKLMILLLVYLM